jgi:prepilin-type N-terminal cleavage/methylation domain-containing protein
MKSQALAKRGFTIIELFVVIAIIGVVLALLFPAIARSREAGRRNQCINNMKQIGLALLNYEDKLHYLPPISTNTDMAADIPGDATATTDPQHSAPGTAPSSGAGYSWMILIWPEIEETPRFMLISNQSQKFTLPAFSPELTQELDGNGSAHAGAYNISYYKCPSFSFDSTVDTSARTVGNSSGNIETGSAPPNYVNGVGALNGGKGLAITNYNAILGTHIDSTSDEFFGPRSASLANSNNGGMMFRGRAYNLGTTLAELTDGTSKVPLIVETRERRFSSWYDGTMNWVVAARHSKPSDPTTAITAATMATSGPMTGRWTIGTDGTSATGGTALNYGPTPENPTAVYLPTAALSDPDITGIAPGRLWGPSSQHAGGIVNHVFADAHVGSTADTIDPNTYLWVVTRHGEEPGVNCGDN